MDNFNIQEFISSHITKLNEEAILKLNSASNDVGLNNVVVGLNKHCYGLWLIDDGNESKYQMFYINSDQKLEGDLIELTTDLDNRDEIVLYFSHFLTDKYKDLDTIDLYNSFQNLIRGMFEKIEYYTITTQDIENYSNFNSKLIVKDKKGIIVFQTISKGDYYRRYFGNKDLPKEPEIGQYVYLMLNKRNGFIKIGRSKSPMFREKTFQAEEPDIELISFWKAPNKYEKILHNSFTSKRQRGEWFELNFKDLQRIKEIMVEFEN